MQVEWRPEYVSGNDDIDTMHRTIIDRLAVLGEAARYGCAVAPAFRDLRSAVLGHFEAEERLLAVMSDTASAGHRREHALIARLLRDGEGLCCDAALVQSSLPPFLDVVGRWLLHEIGANDRDLFAFLAARRRAAVLLGL